MDSAAVQSTGQCQAALNQINTNHDRPRKFLGRARERKRMERHTVTSVRQHEVTAQRGDRDIVLLTSGQPGCRLAPTLAASREPDNRPTFLWVSRPDFHPGRCGRARASRAPPSVYSIRCWDALAPAWPRGTPS